MAQLRQNYTEFQARETEVIVVGPESVQEFKQYWEENNLQFTGIPDPKHSVLKLYGQQINLFKMGRMPAQALIDRNGIARFVHYGKSMRDIPDTGSMLALIDEINRESQTAGQPEIA